MDRREAENEQEDQVAKRRAAKRAKEEPANRILPREAGQQIKSYERCEALLSRFLNGESFPDFSDEDIIIINECVTDVSPFERLYMVLRMLRKERPYLEPL